MITKLRYDANDRDAWLKLRTSLDDKLGGSEVGSAANHNKYSSFVKMLAERVGLVEKEDISDKMAVKLGHWNEEFVANEFEARSGKKVHKENCIFLNDEYPHLKASIDRKIANEDSGLECKFMSDMTMRSYPRGEFPETYKDQCVTYLAVTGLKRWYLAIVTNSRFYCFLMTRDPAEEVRYYALKAMFATEPLVGDLSNNADYAEWKANYSYLNAVYHLDDAEMAGAEIVAAHFIDCVNQVNAYMEGQEFKTPAERKAFLTNAVYQVIDPSDLDGSDATEETLKEMFAHAVAESVLEVTDSAPDCKELTDLIAERQQKKAEAKALKDRLDEIDNQIRGRIKDSETMLLPTWKVVCKNHDGKRSCSVETVETYFTNKGEAVPEGLITQGAGYRDIRVYVRKEKAAKKPRKAKETPTEAAA